MIFKTFFAFPLVLMCFEIKVKDSEGFFEQIPGLKPWFSKSSFVFLQQMKNLNFFNSETT